MPLNIGAMPVTISALTWNSGSPPSTPSPGASPLHTAIPSAQASWLAWVCAAIFGAPVVPPVCTNAARSSAVGRFRAGQVVGRLPGDHVVQVGHDRPAAVRVSAGGRVTGQGGRVAVRAVGPQREDGGHPRLAGHPEQPMPQLRVQLGAGRDQDA